MSIYEYINKKRFVINDINNYLLTRDIIIIIIIEQKWVAGTLHSHHINAGIFWKQLQLFVQG